MRGGEMWIPERVPMLIGLVKFSGAWTGMANFDYVKVRLSEFLLCAFTQDFFFKEIYPRFVLCALK